MLDAPVDPREEGLLHCGVDQVVVGEVVGEPVGEEEVKSLANATTESDHTEVPRV